MGEHSGGRILAVDAIRHLVESALRAPLGPDLGELTLMDFGGARRLSELRFEFALSYEPDGVLASRFSEILKSELSEHESFGAWSERLDFGERRLRGSFTGSIDAVLGFEGEHGVKCALVDYKSNDLSLHASRREDAYSERSMRDAMIEHAYPLQAIFYQVVLHRYLKSRVRAYDPAVHLGSPHYLFVRGMGPDEGAQKGVFRFDIPVTLVERVSALFAEGVATSAR
jgi:exodeoxyribonuclease V beta subunit